MYCPRSNGKQCTKMCWLSCLFFYIHCLSFLALLHAAAAAAKLLLLCLTLCDPIDISPPCSSAPEFSRKEHWSGLPFPSPMHESEK